MEKRTEKSAEEKQKQELKNEEADLVTGGAGFGKVRCPSCGSHFFTIQDGSKVCSGCGRSY